MLKNRWRTLLAAGLVGATCAPAAAQAPFLSEIFVDGPGADQGQEFVEISGPPGFPLNGRFLVFIDGDGANGGQVDQVISLDGLALGPNGLLLIRDTAAVLQPPPDPSTPVVIRDFVPDIENGSQTFLLVMGGPPPAVGADLDANNDGTLDGPFPGTVVDAVSILEAGAGQEFDYADDVGGVSIPQQVWTADALIRLHDEDGTPADVAFGGWAAADVLGTAPGPYPLDAAENFNLTPNGLNIADLVLSPGNRSPFILRRGACCVGTSCTQTYAFACSGTFLVGVQCSPNPCNFDPTGACCLFGNCTTTTASTCFGNFFPGVACTTFLCAPIITSFSPPNPAPGDTLTIIGSGFGNNPDNLCLVAAIGPRLVPIDVFQATENQLRGIVGPVDADQVGVPGQLMVMLGEGARGPFRPAFFDIFVEDPLDTWVWRQDNPNAGAAAPQPIFFQPTPPRPRTFYIHGRVVDGKLCIFLDPSQPWMTNSKITLWNRLHGNQGGTQFRFRDLKTCVRFRLPNGILSCANRLCDVMRCAFGQQVPPIQVDCVVLPQADGRVKLEVSLPGGTIANGTFTICVEKALMIPTPPLNLPITGFGGATITPPPMMPAVMMFDPNGAGFTVDGIPNNGLDGLQIEMLQMDLTGGRELHLQAWGRAGGMEDASLGTAGLRRRPDSFFDVFTDFTDIGGTQVRVIGLDGTTEVANYIAPAGVVGRLLSSGIVIGGCGKVPPRFPPVWCFWIDPDQRIPLLPPGATVPIEITELRLLAVNPTLPIEALRQYDVGATNPAGLPPLNVPIVRVAAFPNPCIADINNSGTVTVQDIFDFLMFYFGNDPRADVNNSGTITVQDIFDYLALYFAGCP